MSDKAVIIFDADLIDAMLVFIIISHATPV